MADRPKMFLDIKAGDEPLGRIKIEVGGLRVVGGMACNFYDVIFFSLLVAA